MGRIIMTIAGPWTEAPDIDSPFELSWEPANPNFYEDFRDLARSTEGVSPEELDAVRAHRGLLSVEASFDAPGKMDTAQQGAFLVRNLMEQGAVGVFVDTANKIFTAAGLDGFIPQSPRMVFHLFVEVSGDGHAISTEGMQAFDLPEVRVNYTPTDIADAQAVAFGLAARMVCEGFRPVHRGVYRNTESAPLYDVEKHLPEGDAEDPFVNPHGSWVLTIDL